MAFSLRNRLHLFLGLGISAAAVYLSFRQIDFQTLAAALYSAVYPYLLPAVIGQTACFLLKGIGWRFLLLPAKRGVSPLSTTAVLVIGLMVNNLLPAKMGELARAYLLGEKERLPKSLCLSTILVEHLLDILVLMLFLLLLLPLVSLPSWLRTGGIGIGAAALILIVGLLFLVRREERFLNWADRAAGLFPARVQGKTRDLARNVLQGFRVVNGRYLFYALAFIAAMWFMVSLNAYWVMGAFGLSLPAQAAVMVTVFTAFGKIIPSAPGAIGTYHYLAILVLESFGVGKETALAFALVFHALSFLLEIFMGVAFLWAGHLSLTRIARHVEETT